VLARNTAINYYGRLHLENDRKKIKSIKITNLNNCKTVTNLFIETANSPLLLVIKVSN
jgi:hypothetical protein